MSISMPMCDWYGLAAAVLIAVMGATSLDAGDPCRIVVTDEASGWPVPLVEFKTTHQVRFVTDNAGVIAIDDPTLMNREVWFTVTGHGYGVKRDGFGNRGIRLIPKPGGTLEVKVERASVAMRIGRLTGSGLFAESQKLGGELDWQDGPVFGCDSVQNAVHHGKLYWAWGDTQVPHYPLGVFHMTGATTSLRPFASLEPPLRPKFDRFLADGRPRALAEMPGSGPTWLTGFCSLPDHHGTEKLVAVYRKISPPLDVYEAGLCVWNDETERFEHLRTVWKKSDGQPQPPVLAEGHSAIWTDVDGREWLLFGNPFAHVRLPANFEAWQDTANWEPLTPQRFLLSASNGAEVTPHSGSMAWNAFRQRWVTVFMQKFGKPSAFGTLWYAEAVSPLGPWGPAVEILSHENYTFYNPRIHHHLATSADEPVLLFEGTYTAEFADRPVPTPRYDYNQILYRLNLDDPRLKPAAH